VSREASDYGATLYELTAAVPQGVGDYGLSTGIDHRKATTGEHFSGQKRRQFDVPRR
jgi:hypothetical protein